MNAGDQGDYVLGTGDEEVERLGLQHRVWRPTVLEAWKRAGFGRGETILDAGSGPGFATLDLADIVGPFGRVVAIERSKHYASVLRTQAARRAPGNLTIIEAGEPDVGLAIPAWLEELGMNVVRLSPTIEVAPAGSPY